MDLNDLAKLNGTESSKNFRIIAGPCSVETFEQLDETVASLVKGGIRVIRGGVWKPRTRPNQFEGLGKKALPWIKEIKDKYAVKFAVEVANANHVEEALSHDIDILWLGARTTVNPFMVQEIADSLSGVSIPVMVKNPVNPDLALWIGALERIQMAGIKDVTAIHRGFSNFNDHTYRNSPMWQIPIALKTEFPELPIITDPSHICGRRDLIADISQMALDLNFDGLMIESHYRPNEAWSDAAQQLTPVDLMSLLNHLVKRKGQINDVTLSSQLEFIREQIDEADRHLLEILGKRMLLVEKAGVYKKINNVAIFQLERWKKIFESRPEWGKDLNINEAFVSELFQLIHTESIKKQEEVMSKPLIQDFKNGDAK